MCVYLLDNLVVVVADASELPVEIVEPCNIFCSRRVTFEDPKLSAEEASENEFRDILCIPGLFHHLPEAGFLLLIELEIVAVNLGVRSFGTPEFSLCHSHFFLCFTTPE